MNEKPSISAVIISYHGMDFIPDCIASLKLELKEYEHQIIVIDNNSTDGSVEFIEKNHPDIKLVKNERNLGFARAVNQGIEAAGNDILWLLNQDLRFRPGCLDALMACYRRLEKPGVIGPKLVGFDGRLQKFCRRFPAYHHLFFELTGLARIFNRSRFFNGWKMGDFDHLSSREVDQPMGAAMLVGRQAAEEIGGLDESFGIFFNDVDFCRRLSDAGYTNFYCAGAVVEHYGGGSVSRQKAKMVWLSHYSMFRYFRKWEKSRSRSPLSAAVSWIRPGLAGLFLLASAVPRSAWHTLRKII